MTTDAETVIFTEGSI